MRTSEPRSDKRSRECQCSDWNQRGHDISRSGIINRYFGESGIPSSQRDKHD
jgi:hypothetical protein